MAISSVKFTCNFYLVAGIIVGQHELNIANEQVDYEHFAKLGIVFLLFTLGLEFSLI